MKNIDKKGKVYWITGLAGSGKSTIAKLLSERLTGFDENVIYLDGDILRDILGEELGHNEQDRRTLSLRYSKLCQLLSNQGICVVGAFLALFHEVHKLNRKNIIDYREIYIDVPMEELIKRDQKKLYSRSLNGEVKNVVGMDIAEEKPEKPDLIIKNYGQVNPDNAVNEILQHFDVN